MTPRDEWIRAYAKMVVADTIRAGGTPQEMSDRLSRAAGTSPEAYEREGGVVDNHHDFLLIAHAECAHAASET